MANYSNLSSLFTAIADAIRAKTGKTETIVADNFPSEIAAIETGGGGSSFTVSVTLQTDGSGITAYFDENGTRVVVADAGERTVNALYGIVYARNGFPPSATGDYVPLLGEGGMDNVYMFKSDGGVVDNAD